MKLIQGWGVNDAGRATFINELGVKTHLPDYEMWKAVINRTCSDKEKLRRPYSSECSCDSTWKYRSNFKRWYDSQKYYVDSHGIKLQIDKDLLVKGNKIYGPDTCCLIPRYINTVFKQPPKSGIDGAMMWVRYHPKTERMIGVLKKPWRATICHNGSYIELGMFQTQLEAHLAAQEAKMRCILDIAERYSQEYFKSDLVLQAILNRAYLLENSYKNSEVVTCF